LEVFTSAADMAKANKKNTKGKKTALRPILKISLFTFLVWIGKSSNNDGNYEGANGAQNLGKSQILRNGRLLSEQPKIEFDAVFSTFKDSFLDKMGLGDQEQNQIKDMMHSYFKNLDLAALERQVHENPEMFQQFAQFPNSLSDIQVPPNLLEQFPPPPGMLEQFNLPPDVLEKFPPPPNMLEEFQKDPNNFGPFGPLSPSMSTPPQPGTSASSDGEPKPGTSASFHLEPKPGTSSKEDDGEKPGPSSSMPGPSSSMPGPSSSMPGPSSGMPGPSSGMPGPSSGMPGPSSGMPGPSSGMPGPSSGMPGPSSGMPGPCSGMPGPLPPFPAFTDLFGPPKPGACENGQPCMPNFNFLEELQKNANSFGEPQKGENGVPGNLRGVEPKKDNKKQDGEQEGNNLTEGSKVVLEEGKEEKKEEATEGEKKKEKKKQVVVEEEENSEEDDDESDDQDEEFVDAIEEGNDEVFEDAVEKFEDLEQPPTLPQFPSQKAQTPQPQTPEPQTPEPQTPQSPEQTNFQPFGNFSFPGMPNLDMLLGQQLAKNEETSALTSFVNKLNLFGIDAKLSVNATFLVGLAYYNVKYFVYIMMFIIGLNLFRELGDIFTKFRLLNFNLHCYMYRHTKKMVFSRLVEGATPGKEPGQYAMVSSNSDGGTTAKDHGRGKIMGVFSACKVVTFALLFWLVQCCSMYSDVSMQDHYNMGRTAAVRPSRLLGEPVVEFDAVFDLYQRSFLDKMGCDSKQKDEIRTMMKSYFDKIDLGALAQQFEKNPWSMLQCPPGMPGMFLPQSGACPTALPGMCKPSNDSILGQSNPNESKSADPKEKKEGEENTSNGSDEQGTEGKQDGKIEDQKKIQMIFPTDNSNRSPVSNYLNFFNYLWSPSFIVMSSLMSACFGQYQLMMALFSILFLKGRTMMISYGGANVISACGGRARNVMGGDGYRNVEGLAGQCPRKGVKYAAFLKLLMFALFIWIVQDSHRSTRHGIAEGIPQQEQVAVHKGASRLLAESQMNFDEVYGTFKEHVLEKLGCDEEECQKVRNSVKSYFDKIKWNVENEQSAKESEEESGGSDNSSDRKNKGKRNYKCAGILGSLIDSVVNYKLTSLTIFILALGYFKSRYLLVVMSAVILLNVFWELESLNKKLKIL
ncbi:Pv-fam-h protein, partial [Plasmodium coatneyi]